MNCILCQKPKKLCDSHIIAEFFYKLIYDDLSRRRIEPFKALTPDKHERPMQKGPRSPLLCEECEGKRNTHFETPMKEYWVDIDPLQVLENSSSATIRGIDYASFKLFHLSVLLCAHYAAERTRDSFFATVKLSDADLISIHEMWDKREAGPYWKYPIVASAILEPDDNGGVWRELITSPLPATDSTGKAYILFCFGGCQWRYYLTPVLTPWIESRCLKEDGSMFIEKREWEPMQMCAELVAQAN